MVYKHGFNRVHTVGMERFYRIWIEVNGRCNNPNRPHYKNYGGRGVKSDWTGNFIKFRDEMYESYLEHFEKFGKDTSIDRIDNAGDYCKSNCRWATQREQMNNYRGNIILTFNGKTQSLSMWARDLGIKYGCLRSRVRYGWKTEEILGLPTGSGPSGRKPRTR